MPIDLLAALEASGRGVAVLLAHAMNISAFEDMNSTGQCKGGEAAPPSRGGGHAAAGSRAERGLERDVQWRSAGKGPDDMGASDSTGKPASRQASSPPLSGRTFLKPIAAARSATRALVASRGSAQ